MIPRIEIHDKRIVSFIFGMKVDSSIYKQARAFNQYIQKEWKLYIIETNNSYHIVTVFFNRDVGGSAGLLKEIIEQWKSSPIDEESSSKRKLTIPVCYEEPFCLDIDRVTKISGLTRDEMIEMHSTVDYLVYLIGFLPGFPYLGGLKEELAIPRLHLPRKKVEGGSVGIGGEQTGIYPIELPGGWNIIGKTPICLYDANRTSPFLFQSGDWLAFNPISHTEFEIIKKHLDLNKEDVFEIIKIEQFTLRTESGENDETITSSNKKRYI